MSQPRGQARDLFSFWVIIFCNWYYIGDLSEKGREGVTTGAMNMMFYFGIAAGPFLGGFLNYAYGFNSIFYTMFGLGLVTFFMVLFFIPESRIKKSADIQRLFNIVARQRSNEVYRHRDSRLRGNDNEGRGNGPPFVSPRTRGIPL